MPPRLLWREATVVEIVEQTPTVKSFFLRVPEWHSFVPGQHVDVRLTAPDGYQAERSYSIGSAPDGTDTIELIIEKLDDGEVSPFFHDVVAAGDTIELRGPIGGHFNWSATDGGPILLLGGGSGVVPLMAILRHRAAMAPGVPMALVYSARRWDDVIFRDELMIRNGVEPLFSWFLTLTRETAPVQGHRSGRIERMLIGDALRALGEAPRLCFVCGANAFVDAAAMLLVNAGIPAGTIRTERYGGNPVDEPSAVVPEV